MDVEARLRRSLFGNGGSGRGRVFGFFELSSPDFSELINAGRTVTTGSNFSLMNHGGAVRRISRLACPSSPLLNIHQWDTTSAAPVINSTFRCLLVRMQAARIFRSILIENFCMGNDAEDTAF